MRREKEEKEKEHRRQQQKGGPTKLSKPEPAKSAFIFFKEAHAKLSAEEVKTAWANLPEADKQVSPIILNFSFSFRRTKIKLKPTNKEKRKRRRSGPRHKL